MSLMGNSDGRDSGQLVKLNLRTAAGRRAGRLRVQHRLLYFPVQWSTVKISPTVKFSWGVALSRLFLQACKYQTSEEEFL